MHSLWKPILEIIASNVVIVAIWATFVSGSSNYYVYLSPDEVEEMEVNKTRCRILIKQRERTVDVGISNQSDIRKVDDRISSTRRVTGGRRG